MVSIDLQPLSESKYEEYFREHLEEYARDLTRTDFETLEGAREKVSRKTQLLLPEGRLTPLHHFFEVRYREQDVGRAWLHVNPDERLAWLYHIRIHPEHRRKGLGRRTLLALFQRSKELGARVFWLNVLEDNEAARGLYQSMGFRSVARHMNLLLD